MGAARLRPLLGLPGRAGGAGSTASWTWRSIPRSSRTTSGSGARTCPSLERWALVLAFIWILTALNLAGRAHHGRRRGGARRGCRSLPVLVLHRGRGHAAPARRRGGRSPRTDGSLLDRARPRARGHDVELLGLGHAHHLPRRDARRRARAFRRALFVALPLITLAYVLPVAAGARRRSDGWADWDTGHWPVVAAAVGGPWLAALVTAGALIATGGPLPVAAPHQLAAALRAGRGRPDAAPRSARVHPRFGTPWVAVIAVERLLQRLRVLELQGADRPQRLALLDHARPGAGRLRGAAATASRGCRGRGGWAAARAGHVAGRGAARALCCLLAMATAGWLNTAVGVAAALTGPLAYLVWRNRSRALRRAGGRGVAAMTPMDPADHLRRAWRVHALAAADGPPASRRLGGRRADSGRARRSRAGSRPSAESGAGVATRVLFGIRWAVGSGPAPRPHGQPDSSRSIASRRSSSSASTTAP